MHAVVEHRQRNSCREKAQKAHKGSWLRVFCGSLRLRASLVVTFVAWVQMACAVAAAETAGVGPASAWIERFSFLPPDASAEGLCPPSGTALPSFTITPAAPGRQLVRVSLPFSPGTFPAETGLAVSSGGQEIVPAIRVLTHHPGRPRSVRRAMVTFIHDFPDRSARQFHTDLRALPSGRAPAASRPAMQAIDTEGRFSTRIGKLHVQISAGAVRVMADEKLHLDAEFAAPPLAQAAAPVVEMIEHDDAYVWVRLLTHDAAWPRIIDVRADGLGTVAVRGHLQRLDGTADQRPTAPDLGWRIRSPRAEVFRVGESLVRVSDQLVLHQFDHGRPASVEAGGLNLDFPDAHLHKRGRITACASADASEVTYWRCQASERVPHQLAAWRTATFVLRPGAVAPLTALLEPPHGAQIPAAAFAEIYDSGASPDLSPWPLLAGAARYHRDAIASCLVPGDDYGNVSSMPTGSVFGMNRLNHCPPIIEEYYRSGDERLRSVALEWCANMHDLSLWWGTDKPGHFGGTRYNNMARHHEGFSEDREFMWRSDTAVSFCTKGFDSFFYAYEETGDPRMATALRWQVDYAAREIHCEREMRNVGDVADFLRLHRFMGSAECMGAALRLFHELRGHLSPGDLFSQGGQQIVEDTHFIAEDQEGTKHPFAKPYIIGYALAGLPELTRYHADEPKLIEVIRAVAGFQAAAQDPVGGWRYPHPRSPGTIVSQGIEHAMQLVNAADLLERRGESIEPFLDAIERVLQARVLAWQRTGQFFGGLGSWEEAAGLIKKTQTWYELYQRPQDRDATRDYSEGAIAMGSAPPEGVVHFPQVLVFYLQHRPAERLFHANQTLQKVLNRMTARTQPAASMPARAEYLRYGVEAFLPTFRDELMGRLTFPQRYDAQRWPSFAHWRREARATLLRSLLTPPPRADFAPVMIAREDRGTYEARKLVFNVSDDARVPAYLLVPRDKGPLPAVLALHDHGAFFEIGKEKVVRPFDESPERIRTAQAWVEKNYGSRFIGDELARRGYVVLAIDALFWGDRGRKEGVDYTAQQALAANLLQLGMTWLGVITWDDIRSAEFLASLPEVDPQRIAAVGLSMGSHRTWMLAAATDHIAAGMAICWMGTTPVLIAPGNNQVKGHSAYSMIAPDLVNSLDRPDVASIACPKPMLFYNGDQDGLFPVKGVEDAYATLQRVWASQGAAARLETRIWPRPHVFDAEMQEAAFSWLEAQLNR